MSRVLRLYNSYSRCIQEAKLARGELIAAPQVTGPYTYHGSLYICGPTVYAESHLGHALTYVRADLFRRVLKSLFNVKLTTVMNITDVDDKILAKSRNESPADAPLDPLPEKHPFNQISEKYCQSFIDDMSHIRVTPPDLTIRVSKQIRIITDYIRRLEKRGHAYLASNGDIYFRVSSVKNYQGRVDGRKLGDQDSRVDEGKSDERDFALWKAAKPNEPVWFYRSVSSGLEVPGRPGWHVQCSAISSAIFGNRLDFHFGGKDLIFPHNYNEQACCCAYHGLDTTRDINVWSANWLHSGHLVLKDDKMSKSLGNVVGIKEFINDSSVNAIRLLCVDSHYRSDVTFDASLLQKMKLLDHKVGAFVSYLTDACQHICDSSLETSLNEGLNEVNSINLEAQMTKVREDILSGVCDDFDLAKGLYSILDLSKMIYNAGQGNIRARDLVMVRQLLTDWCSMCGLVYGSASGTNDENLIRLVRNFRHEVRDLAIAELKRRKHEDSDSSNEFLLALLGSCDNVRSRLDELGLVIRDNKTDL